MSEGDESNKVVNLFTRKPVEQAVPSSEPAAEAAEFEDGGEDVEFFKNNGEHIAYVATEAGTMEKMISNIPGFSRNERNIDIRLQGLKDTPLSRLCESITSSTQNMWRGKPSYYLAVVAELSHRIDSLQRTEHGSTEKSLAADILFVLSDPERTIQAIEHTNVITAYVIDERGLKPNHTEMALHGGEVSGYTLAQICDVILDSSNKDWAAKPNYYGAAIVELDGRTKAIKDILYRDEIIK